MSDDFIENASAVINRLRSLDTRRVVFGSERHAYRFNPPLSPQEVQSFEAVHDVSLPTPYRRFVTELGNGGAGPFYGVLPLELELPELLQPFPFTQVSTLPDGDEEVWKGRIPGAITIAEYGCGTYFLLAVRGELAGEVWVDARYETGISPAANDPTKPVTFDVWWLSVMRDHLDRFERVLAMMEAETDHEEIHRRLEPRVLQLEVDTTMLSLMDRDPTAKPRVYADKPWGQECGLVEDYYGPWVRERGKQRGRKQKGRESN
jgi:hypothetical protein